MYIRLVKKALSASVALVDQVVIVLLSQNLNLIVQTVVVAVEAMIVVATVVDFQI